MTPLNKYNGTNILPSKSLAQNTEVHLNWVCKWKIKIKIPWVGVNLSRSTGRFHSEDFSQTAWTGSFNRGKTQKSGSSKREPTTHTRKHTQHSHVLWCTGCGRQRGMKAGLAAHTAAVTAETVNLSSARVIRSDAPWRVEGVFLIDIIVIPVPEDDTRQPRWPRKTILKKVRCYLMAMRVQARGMAHRRAQKAQAASKENRHRYKSPSTPS